MPSGFVMPVHTITRLSDGKVATSTRKGGCTQLARYFGENVESFKCQMKIAWSQHIDTNARSFRFMTLKSTRDNLGTQALTQYHAWRLVEGHM